jgi:hypothetical protein
MHQASRQPTGSSICWCRQLPSWQVSSSTLCSTLCGTPHLTLSVYITSSG